MAKVKTTNPSRLDPYRNYKFRVFWGGRVVAGFSELEISTSVMNAVDVREGPEPGAMRKVQGVHKSTDITFKRGVIDATVVFDWIQAAVNRDPHARRDVALAVLGNHRREVVRWALSNAWITKIQSADLKAKGNDVAVESLELTNEGIAPA